MTRLSAASDNVLEISKHQRIVHLIPIASATRIMRSPAVIIASAHGTLSYSQALDCGIDCGLVSPILRRN